MTAPQLAKTTFRSGPEDELAVIDVYEKQGSGVVNSYQETHKDSIDVLDSLNGEGAGEGGGEGGGGSTPDGSESEDPWESLGNNDDLAPNNDLSDLTGGLDGAPDVGSAGEAERLANMDPDTISDIDDLDENVRDGMCFRGDSVDEVFADVNGIETKIPRGINFNSLNSMNNIIGRLSGGNIANIIDRGGAASLVASSVLQGSRMGIPNVFGGIVNGVAAGVAGNGKINNNVLARAVGMMIPEIVRNANIPVLGDIARSPFGNILARAAPGIIGNTIRNIARPTGLPQSGYSSYYGNARDTFGLVDPNWNRTTFGGQPVMNATVVSQNDFMQESMYANVTTRPLQISTTPSGNSRYTNTSDVYYNNPSTFDRDYNTGGEIYSQQGTVVPSQPIDIYNRRTQQRKDDAFMVAATSFGQATVAGFLAKKFAKTNIKINRSIGFF